MAHAQWAVWWMVWCLVVVMADSTMLQQAFFNHSQPTAVNNTPIIALGSPLFATVYTLSFNQALVAPSTPSLKVKLTPPYKAVDTSTGCKLFTGGVRCASTSSVPETYVDMQVLVRGMSLTVSPAVTVEKVVNVTTASYVEFDFGVVSINSSISDPDKTIVISMVTRLLPQAESTDRVTVFVFQGDVRIVQGNPGTLVSSTAALTYILERPLVQVSYSASPALLTASVTSTVTITIDHSYLSTASATNLQVALNVSEAVATYNGDAAWSKDGGSTTNSTDVNQVTGSAMTLSSTSSLGVSYSVTASSLPQLNAMATALVTVTYSGLLGNGSQMEFVDSFPVGVYTQRINLTTGAADDVTLQASIPALSDLVITQTMSVPQGIIRALTFGSYFSSDELNPIPLKWVSSTVTYSPPSLTFSQPAYLNVTSAGFTSATSRRKRAVTATIATTRNVGDVINPGPSPATVKLQVTLAVGNAPAGGALTAADTYISVGGTSIYLSATAATFVRPLLTLSKTAAVDNASHTPQRLQFSLVAEHDARSNAPAYDVTLIGGNDYFDVYWWDGYSGPAIGSLAITDDRKFEWTQQYLANGSVMTMVYKADAATNQDLIPDGDTWINATLTYKASMMSSATFSATGACCISKVDVGSTSLLVKHGLTVLSFTFGVIFGVVVLVIAIYVIVRVLKKVLFPCCNGGYPADPESNPTSAALFIGSTLSRAAQVTTRYFRSKWMYSDSIVGILRRSDRIEAHRDLDNNDIQVSMYLDTQIEEERDRAVTTTSQQLVKGLRNNGDISQAAMKKCNSTLQKNMADVKKASEQSIQKNMNDVYVQNKRKNENKREQLKAQHEEELRHVEETTWDCSAQEKTEMRKLAQQKQEIETTDLAYAMNLEQESDMEKIRKEAMAHKRIAIKRFQQDALDELNKETKLTTEQARWLMEEHLKKQDSVDKFYEDEIARQRSNLEERLERRKALEEQNNVQKGQEIEMFNKLAKEEEQAINKLNFLNADEAQDLIDEARADILTAQKNLEVERERQEEKLQKALSERKKKRLEEQAQKHAKEIKDLEKKQKSHPKTYVDPLVVLEDRGTLLSTHRNEVNDVEIEMDSEHADELFKLRQRLSQEAREGIEEQMVVKLRKEGLSEKKAGKLMSEYKTSLVRLEQMQQKQRETQQQEAQEKISKRKQELEAQREEENEKRKQIRDCQDQVARKLMENQITIAEDERNRIMQEHEKQMVQYENSVTLSKLRSRQLLEEELTARRAQQLEKLRRSQAREAQKKTRQMRDADSDMDDEERHLQEMEMMARHAQQTINILHGDTIKLEDEMDKVREKMENEREECLAEQNQQLGAFIAALQMEKAKEMAGIVRKQKAIHELKTSLLDDLSEKGALSDTKCQRVIEMHRRDQDKLQATLDEQRAKQEADLKRRLQEHLVKKEAKLAALQEEQLKKAASTTNNAANRIRLAVMKQKYLMEMEHFRIQMEKQINQTLEEVRRQNDIQRIQNLQSQELQFINGLVRLGTFTMDDLQEVIALMFPLKSQEEQKQMLATLTDGYSPTHAGRHQAGADHTDGPPDAGTLVERVQSVRHDKARARSALSDKGFNEKRKTYGKKRKKKRLALRENQEQPKWRLPSRPEPIGRSNSPDYFSDEDPHPPRYPSSRKKRFTQRYQTEDY